LCGCKVDEDVEIQLGLCEGDISPIIDSLCMNMKKDSKIMCKTTFKNDSLVLSGACIEFIIHLISIIEQAVPIYRLAPYNCFQYAIQCKDAGTHLFKQSKIHVAALFYAKSIKYLIIAINSLDENSKVEYETSREILAVCHTNLAACLLSYKLFSKVIVNCTDALHIQPSNVKALYRRAVSYLSLNDFENAENDISLGSKLSHQCKAFSKLSSNLKEKIAFSNAQLSSRLKTLFT